MTEKQQTDMIGRQTNVTRTTNSLDKKQHINTAERKKTV